MSIALVIFPHQLFKEHPGLLHNPTKIIVIEDPLFFGSERYIDAFHKQKLWFHRATMMHFAAHLKKSGRSVDYIEHQQRPLQSGHALAEEGYTKLIVAELHDDLLERRSETPIIALIALEVMHANVLEQPGAKCCLSAREEAWFMADIHKHQRRRLNISYGRRFSRRWSVEL